MKRVLLLLLLLQVVPVTAYFHNDSPINWNEYNQKSFDLAEKENKPVFMLITAVWCHWCHVYRDKTLHKPEVYEYINENFISVFVDADKRQDLTRQYLAGGWPSTVIFAPNGVEVNRINGMIQKGDLLDHLQKVVSHFESGKTWKDDEKEYASIELSVISQDELKNMWDKTPVALLSSYDKEFGGFGSQRKFPMSRVYEFFLYRYQQTNEPVLLEATELALDNMAPEDFIDFNKKIDNRVFKGIYDPIEGGFFRYNTRRNWEVPHYEKMLDANAYLIRSYLLAYDITKNKKYREIAENSLKYIITQLQDDSGRLYGSQDAGIEYYYRQTEEERSAAEFEASPFIDTTTYADWSGPMITTFLVAGEILNSEDYTNQGVKVASFIKENMIEEGVLHFYDGTAQLNGLLLDNAEIASAFFDVYEFTDDNDYLIKAEEILDFTNQRLYNRSAGAYYERNSSDAHLYRKNDAFLGLFPTEGNTAMASALIKAHKATGKPEYKDRALAVMGFLSKNTGGSEDLAVTATVADYLQESSLEFENEPIQAGFILMLFVAFIAGVISFLSPCTLPLLPAYAVHILKAKHDAVKRTVAFFLGLALVFSVLGVSAALVGQLLTKLIPKLSMVAGAIIMLFGVLTFAGKGFGGFQTGKLKDGVAGSFLFGASYGVAWTPCVGPILAGIFVMAATAASWAQGGILLFAYALGIAIPLLVLSYYIDRLQKGRLWKILKGKELTFKIGKRKFHIHTTNLIAGLLLMIIGYLIFSGTLYTFNRVIVETPLQQQIFSLEDWLLGFLK